MGFNNIEPISFPVASATVIRANRFCVIGANGMLVEANDGQDAQFVSRLGSAAGNDDAIPAIPLNGCVVEVEAGAAIDVSANVIDVASDNDGRAITAAGADSRVGKALDSAAAAGDIIRIYGMPAPRNS